MPKTKIFFHHIPKTAGTTLIGLLNQHFSLFEIKSDGLFGKPARNVRKEDVINNLEVIQSLDLIHGHFDSTLFDSIIQDYYRVTILRDPFKRICSLYNDWRSKSEESLLNVEEEEAMVARKARELNLTDFISQDVYPIPTLFDNAQVRLLSGAMIEENITEEHLEKAIKTLDAMDFVGITEMMGASVFLLFNELGWEAPDKILKANKRNYNPENCITSEVIRNAIKWDTLLYNYALGLFDQFVISSLRKQSPSFKAKLAFPVKGSSVLDMSMGFNGYGWHVREGVGSEVIWRWTGPTRRSSIRLNLKPGFSIKILIYIISVIDEEILHNMNLYMNKHSLSWSLNGEEDGQKIVEMTVPAEVINQEGNDELVIEVARLASHYDLDNNITDKRMKGLAITKFKFEFL